MVENLLDLPNLDVHVHTPYSVCCEDITLAKLRDKAQALDIVYAVTDHSSHLYFPREFVWNFFRLGQREYEAFFQTHREAGRRRIERYLIEAREGAPLVGVEVDILPDGRLLFEEDLYGELDLVVGSVHYLPAVRQKKEAPVEEIHAEFRWQTETLAASGRIHVLGHPFRALANYQVPVPGDLVEWVVRTCQRHGVALEINSHYQYPELDRQMVASARRHGARIVIGSDAHFLREFGEYSYQRDILETA